MEITCLDDALSYALGVFDLPAAQGTAFVSNSIPRFVVYIYELAKEESPARN